MNDHRCIHCNEVSPQHTRFCAVLQYGEPEVDYFTDPPDHFAPPAAPGAVANRDRDEEIDSLRAEVAALRDRAEAAERERDALPEMLRAGVGGTEPPKAAKTDEEARAALAIVKEMGRYSGQTVYRKVGDAFVFARWATQEEDDAYITVFQTGLAAGWRARAERDAVIAAAREFLAAEVAHDSTVAAWLDTDEMDREADAAKDASAARLAAAHAALAAIAGVAS